MKRSLTAFALLAILAACSDDPVPEQQADDERSARGEVLGGTISDDMISLDQRRSQSPPLREDPDEETVGQDMPDASTASTDETPPTEAVPQPVVASEDGAQED